MYESRVLTAVARQAAEGPRERAVPRDLERAAIVSLNAVAAAAAAAAAAPAAAAEEAAAMASHSLPR